MLRRMTPHHVEQVTTAICLDVSVARYLSVNAKGPVTCNRVCTMAGVSHFLSALPDLILLRVFRRSSGWLCGVIAPEA
jgi:hypothetical protein